MARSMKEDIIARNIKTLRQERGITLQDLAERTGLTKGYLSKIERAKKAPPFSTINRIAIAMEVDVTFFLNENEAEYKNPKISFTKKDQRKTVETLGTIYGYNYQALAHDKPGKNMIPYIIEPAFVEKGVFQHEGEEFMYTLEGTHELVYDGKKYLMEEGDSVYFDASVPHSGRSIGSKRAKLLAIIYNYKRL